MSVLLRGLRSEAVVLLGFGAVGIASSSFSDSDVAEKSVGIRCCSFGFAPFFGRLFLSEFRHDRIFEERGVAFLLLCQFGKMGVGRQKFDQKVWIVFIY